MALEVVKTDEGVEIRTDNELIAGPSNTEPIRGETLTRLLREVGFSDAEADAIKIALGDVDYVDERAQE